MISIFVDLLEHYKEVFMDNFSVYGFSFDACLDSSLSKVLDRCIGQTLFWIMKFHGKTWYSHMPH